MLFSIYASFRWAKRKNYLPKIAALILVLSFLSSVSGLLGFFVFFSGPIPFLSFPFYEVWSERRINLPAPWQYSDWLNSYEISFVVTPVFQLVPAGPVVGSISAEEGMVQVTSYRIVLLNTEIGAINPDFGLAVLSLFFIMINALGAFIGFLISKINVIKKINWGSKGFWLRIAFGIALLALGLWLSTIGEVAQASPSTYYYSYNPYPYTIAAFATIWFAISWLVAMIVENRLENQV